MFDIYFYKQKSEKIEFDKLFFKRAIKELIVLENGRSCKINVILCDDEYLLTINQEFLQHNYYTDIITFDYSENDIITGEIYISIDRIEENAKLYSKTTENEIKRVIYHGILHLLGYDDKDEEQRRIMSEKENFYLEKLD